MIALDLCPFARSPWADGRVRILSVEGDLEPVVQAVMSAMSHQLDADPDELSTTLIAAPDLADYDDFLDAVGLVEALIDEVGAAPLVQVVGFHPDAIYADADPDDPANATARAPVPVFHLLRADEVAIAASQHPDVEGIPIRNMQLLRRLALGQ